MGFPPVRYQWYFGTNAILGATNATLALSDVQSWQSGQYTVVAANGIGPTTSQPAILTVLPALSLDMVPGLRLIGTLGLIYRIEYLNALGSGSAWTTLATVTLTNNPQPYADFFRHRSAPADLPVGASALSGPTSAVFTGCALLLSGQSPCLAATESRAKPTPGWVEQLPSSAAAPAAKPSKCHPHYLHSQSVLIRITHIEEASH